MRKLVVAAILLIPSLALAQVKQEPRQPKTIINFGETTIDAGPDFPAAATSLPGRGRSSRA
ncbi:MAG: hypothetical protein JST54_33620 [Deltaproteobacteria bacterium]|nr:hypothetical protein [Deltaproteobacteria bacterium]